MKELTSQDHTEKAVLIIPMNNSCSSCRVMTLEKVPYFLSFQDVLVVFSDFSEKRIRLEINEQTLANKQVLIDGKFLSKRFDLVTNYPVMVFSNKEGDVHIKSITGSTFETDMSYIKDILL